MATELKKTSCCGVGEINNLSHSADPKAAVLVVGSDIVNNQMALVTFTGVTKRVREDHAMSGRKDNYGDQLAQFVENSGLGDVVFSGDILNPRTGNTIGLWVWRVKRDVLARWLQANKPAPATYATYHYTTTTDTNAQWVYNPVTTGR